LEVPPPLAHTFPFVDSRIEPSSGTAGTASQRAASLLLTPDILRPLDFSAVFGDGNPVELELGSGDGSFLREYAARHPERNFLGVERLLGRLRKLDRQSRRMGLCNLRGLRLEATYLLGWMISPGALSAIHVYFPDPWPKKRHLRRRLINEAFPPLAARALAPGGMVFLRTDDADYFQQMEEVFANAQGFVRATEPADLLAVTTDFERHFHAQGIPTRHAAWQRTGG
jgi:tRNA (guanine-N7-)-methyltransferase